jgi:hypothetical protein
MHAPLPTLRDRWGYQPVVQLLANRGYAVLQVNFRGSKGFGRKFVNAGEPAALCPPTGAWAPAGREKKIRHLQSACLEPSNCQGVSTLISNAPDFQCTHARRQPGVGRQDAG